MEYGKTKLTDRNDSSEEIHLQATGDLKTSISVLNVNDTSSTTHFVGLSKEELLKYENDPLWKKIRLGLFIGFWVLWCILLVAAILILVKTPPCPKQHDLKWSIRTPGYYVNIRRFVDMLINDHSDAEIQKALIGTFSYIKKMGFGYVIMQGYYNSSLTPLKLSAEQEDLKILRHLDNVGECTDLDENTKNCEALKLAIYNILRVNNFDGIQISVGNQNLEFKENIATQITDYVNNVGRSTLQPRSVITMLEDFLDYKADIKVSNHLIEWSNTSSVTDVVNMINMNSENNGWMFDKVSGPRIVDRGVNTMTAMHIVYLLPGIPIINYGAETFISSEKCNPPLMPWNSTVYNVSTSCNSQNDVSNHNVKRVSSTGYPNSPYKYLRDLSKLRTEHPIFSFGKMSSLQTFQNAIIYWEIRSYLYNVYVIAININETSKGVFHIDESAFGGQACAFTVVHQIDADLYEKYEDSCNIYLPPKSVVVLKSNYICMDK